MIIGTLGSWCSVPWRPGRIDLPPGRTDRLNVERMGAMAGCFCLWSCGVGCRVVLSGHGCGLFGAGGVGRVYGGYRQSEQRLSGVNRRVRGLRSFSAGDVT